MKITVFSSKFLGSALLLCSGFLALLSGFISVSGKVLAEEIAAEVISEEVVLESSRVTPVENILTEPEADTNISTESSQVSIKSDNEAIQILRDRQLKIQEGLEKSTEEKKIDENEEELVDVQIQKENLTEVNAEIQNEVNVLKAELIRKKSQEESLRNSLKTEQDKNSKTQDSLQNLEENIESLQKKIGIKDLVLEKNAVDLEALSQEEELKKAFLEQSVKLKKQLDEREEENVKEKFTIFFGVSGFFILFYIAKIFVTRKLSQSKKLLRQYAPRLAAFDVFSLILYIGFLVWFFFYVKPELVVYLLFLVGAIVMVLQEYIFSMVSSVFIVQRYSIGDRIRFEKREGIIDRLTLLKVNIRDIDDRGTDISEMRVISNSQFMKGTVSLLPRHEIDKFNFRIILPNDLSLNEPALIQRIEENVLQKSITVKSFNEIIEKDYFYDIDFTFTSTGHPVIEISWHETREKSNRIKRKILAEIEEVKKESYAKKLEISRGKEANDDHLTTDEND